VRELRPNQSLHAPQTAGPARGLVCLEAGKRPLQHPKSDPEPLTSVITGTRNLNPKSSFVTDAQLTTCAGPP
jgi:hypothetical protein